MIELRGQSVERTVKVRVSRCRPGRRGSTGAAPRSVRQSREAAASGAGLSLAGGPSRCASKGRGQLGAACCPPRSIPVPRGDSGPQPRPLAGPSLAPGPGTAGWETVGRSQSAMRDGGPKTPPGLAAVAWSPRGETEAPAQADRSLPSPTSAAHCHRPTGPVTKASPGAGVAGREGSRAEGGRVDTQPGPGADGSAVCPGGGRGGGLARPGEPTPSFSTSGLSGSGRRSPHTGGHPLFPRLRSVAGSHGKL